MHHIKDKNVPEKGKEPRLKHHTWSYISINYIENYREQKRKINIKTICRHLEKGFILIKNNFSQITLTQVTETLKN